MSIDGYQKTRYTPEQLQKRQERQRKAMRQLEIEERRAARRQRTLDRRKS